MPWWMWLLSILVLLSLVVLIVLLVQWYRRRKIPAAAVEEPTIVAEMAAVSATAMEPTPQAEEPIQQPPAAQPDEASGAEPADLSPDDLKIIEGIGPKISGVLQAAGITTLAQLAQTDAGELKRILVEAGIRLGDPTTWPEQAGLAAEGKWDALAALQDSLKGGRRV
jgi:predicted flap endonuclease-1-like 5' DNA nuclease